MLYRKRPLIVDAVQYDGGNIAQIIEELGAGGSITVDPGDSDLRIYTSEGLMRTDIGDWVIKGIKGEFYPCKDDIFRMTYDPVG